MDSNPYQGRVLIAEPFLEEPTFKRTAVLIVDHHPFEGTVGFVLNRPMDMFIDQVLDDFPEFESEVFYGGPVKPESLHYIHNVGELLEGSTKILDGVYWGGDFEKLKFLIEQELIQPKNIRFFAGYSGWSEFQLEGELKEGTWLISEMHANYIFKSDPFRLWQQILENKGEVFSVIAQMPDHPILN